MLLYCDVVGIWRYGSCKEVDLVKTHRHPPQREIYWHIYGAYRWVKWQNYIYIAALNILNLLTYLWSISMGKVTELHIHCRTKYFKNHHADTNTYTLSHKIFLKITMLTQIHIHCRTKYFKNHHVDVNID